MAQFGILRYPIGCLKCCDSGKPPGKPAGNPQVSPGHAPGLGFRASQSLSGYFSYSFTEYVTGKVNNGIDYYVYQVRDSKS